MKGIKILLPLAAAALMMSACSSDETIEDIRTSNAIAFNVLSDNNLVTRGTPITSSNLNNDGNNFDVWAFNGTSAYITKLQVKHGSTSTNGAADKKNSGYWSYEGDPYYWPGSNLNFYAIFPSDVDNTSTSMTSNAQSFNYTASKTNTDQKDVMTSSQTASSGTVDFTFHHALSQIIFKAATGSDKMTATISSIKVVGVSPTGAFTFGTDGKTACSASGTATTYTATLSNTSVNSSTASEVTSTSDELLLIPQTLSGSGDAGIGTVTDTPPTTTPYIQLDYKLQDSHNNYVKGSATGDAKVYVPLTGTWVAGNKYVYTLNIEADIITFTCSVDDWTDKTVTDATIK